MGYGKEFKATPMSVIGSIIKLMAMVFTFGLTGISTKVNGKSA